MAGMEMIGLIVGLAGSVVSAMGAIQQGQAQAAALKSEALFAEARAKEERAASQREAIRRHNQAKQVLSRQQALAAAQGGDASDPTILDLMADTAAEGQYQAEAARYEGETRGRGLEAQAAINRMNARAARTAGFINAAGTMLSGISSFAQYRPAALPGPSSLFYG